MHSIARHKNDLLAETVITPLMSNINLMDLVFIKIESTIENLI